MTHAALNCNVSQEQENWTGGLDERGNKIPFPCWRCAAPSCYGKDGFWYCTPCWIDMEAWMEAR